MAGILRTDTIQNSNTSTIITQTNSTTITIGTSGQTIALASGASQSGFGRAGSVNWDTTAKTTGFTAVNGVGYFANTSGGAFIMSLPAGSAGAIVSVADYTNSFQTNALTITPNGSEKINGGAGPIVLNIEGQSLTLVYVDGTEGWKSVQDSTTSTVGSNFIIATGGTILTCGDYKTHVFTGPGTFTVTNAGQPSGSTSVDYLVVAGGGGGGGGTSNPGRGHGSGAGAGGFRMSNFYGLPAPTTSPLANPANIPVTVTAYPITVGAGGSGGPGGCLNQGGQGSNSIFSTITSTGGGGGKSAGGLGPPGPVSQNGNPGGSGGGGGNPAGTAGSGNTPPVSPSQGNAGGPGSPDGRSSGGGGAGAAGSISGNGGDGSYVSNTFFGPTSPSYGTSGPVSSTRYFAGGGAGSQFPPQSYPAGTGGAGGGANGVTCGSNVGAGNAGTTNTGGGASPSQGGNSANGASGGSGIVVIRYRYQ